MFSGKHYSKGFKLTNPPKSKKMESGGLDTVFCADDYDCPLTEDLKKAAECQLREEPLLRKQALESMRHFIEKQQHILKCRLDSNFLLRFLRTKKFSIPIAEVSLDKYVSVRCGFPELMQRLDPGDPALERLLNAGAAFPLLKKENNGITVVLCRQAKINPEIDKIEDVLRFWMMTIEALLEDESNQINGLLFISDSGGNTLRHVAMWGLPMLKKLVLCWEKAMPMRNKGICSLNAPSFMVTLIEIFKNLLSEKISKRIQVYRDVSQLYKILPQDIFPEEYGGGDATVQDMIDNWKSVLESKRKRLLALDDAFMVDENRRQKERDPYGLKELQGSFRKLDID